MAESADLAVVLVTPDRFETIRETIRHLRAQPARDRMEIVIVAPSKDRLELDASALDGFAACQVVEMGEGFSHARGYAAGVRQASTPVVAFGEDHSFPVLGWAEALIEAHRGPWAAVGPAIRNGNPENRVAWADLLIAYAPWLDPASAGEVEHLPGHNSSYKRSVLLEYGPRLDSMLEAESVLHWDLRARGHRLWLQPEAVTVHLNFGRLKSFLTAQFYSGRVFAAARARAWPFARRLLYSMAAPIIPTVRFVRIMRQFRTGRQPRLPRGVLPTLVLGLVVNAAGQMLGYVGGVGEAREKLSGFEFHRVRHLGKRPPVAEWR